MKILIVLSRFNEEICERLLAGAREVLDQVRGLEVKIVRVPGALEIPSVISKALNNGDWAGVLAIGCVIRGGTFHFEIVSQESARALMDLSISLKTPILNAILTTDTVEQALDRSTKKDVNKGKEAAQGLLDMIQLWSSL